MDNKIIKRKERSVININSKEVGKRIYEIRLDKGLTMEEFGKLFNAHKSLVSKWEKGMSLPNKERLKKMAELANITVNQLLYGEENNETDISQLKSQIKELTKERDFLLASLQLIENDVLGTIRSIKNQTSIREDNNYEKI